MGVEAVYNEPVEQICGRDARRLAQQTNKARIAMVERRHRIE
jgi:hypothetical protein